MYRPRRTSEFHDDGRDDGGVGNKRQTRSQLRVTTSSVSKSNQLLHSNWQPQGRQSQFGQDRERGTPLRTVTSSTSKRSVANGTMTMATPMRHRQASSVERPLALHTDKKWVQEQTQLIAEYLNEMVHSHKLQNFPSDFFSRGAIALRQMTMKQFVGIVNFFLHFVWPNRVSVGVNHVDDITSALHKLRYPHPVNKSWLMTPTTQHSIGHVIVMLDFLKDFAPPSAEEQQQSGQYEEFPFMDTSEHPSYVQNTLDSMALSNTQLSSVMLNEEINQLLFTKTGECFSVWDKQKWDEYAVLKRDVSDCIVKSLCDLPDVAALEADIGRKQKELQQLEELAHQQTNNNGEQLEKLLSQQQQLEHRLRSVQEDTKEHREQIIEISARYAQNAESIKSLAKTGQEMQREVKEQKYSAADFQRIEIVLNDLKNKEQFYKRQLSEFSERSYDQQVRLSRAKKHLLDMVEKFNIHAHNIGLDSDICSASEKDKLNLVLPLPLEQDDIRIRSQRLKKLIPLVEQRGAQDKERLRHIEQDIPKLTLQIRNSDVVLNQLNTQLQSLKQQMDQVHNNYKVKNAMWTQHQRQLDERSNELKEKLEQLQHEEEELSQILRKKRQQNEEFLCAIESRHQEELREREAVLKENQDMITKGEQQLKEIETKVKENDKLLASLEKLMEDSKNMMPRFEDELEEVFRSAACV